MTVSGNQAKEPVAEMPAEARRDLYAFLASVFLAPPSSDAMGLFAREGELDEVFGALSSGAPPELDEWRKSRPDAEAVRQSFFDLFRIPGSSYTAPFESVLLREEGQQDSEKGRGESWRDGMNRLMHFYKEVGGAEAERQVAADYIGVELDFMRYLCQREAEEQSKDARERIVETEKTFLKEHLGRWIGLLRKRIERNDTVGFYRLAAALADITVQRHLEQLEARSDG
ncbi:MAG: hypothetical protein D6806_12030 [Deltaproteobacteria bacterium]|nr:MAG: hypothetical protein D6806_12030 [Deltaproteobacteria bacterium]